MLAELLGVPHATAVVKLREGRTARCASSASSRAARSRWSSSRRPACVAVQTGINQVRYASLKGIMAAKKKPIDVKTAADLGLAGQVGAARRQGEDREDLHAAEGRGRRDAVGLGRRGRRASWSARSRSSGFSEPAREMSMGSILVVAEIQKGKIREASYELVCVRAQDRRGDRSRGEEPRDGSGRRRRTPRSSRRRAAARSSSPTTPRSPTTTSTRRSPR